MKAARTTSVSHDEALVAELRDDPALAAEYLQAEIADSAERRVLLVALRQIAHAHGMAEVARRANIGRESLYRALSPSGNPRLSTFVAVLRGLGLALAVEPASVIVRPHRRVRVVRERGGSGRSAKVA